MIIMKPSKAGLTLVELIVLIFILSILVSICFLKFFNLSS